MKNSRSSGVLAGLFIVFLLIGIVIGMLIVHYSNKNKITELEKKLKKIENESGLLVDDNEEITEEEQTAPSIEVAAESEAKEEVFNFYYPVRKVTEGLILKNSYNTENFRIDDGFMAYFDDSGSKISHLGIDLSYHQENVDWDKLFTAPIEFVMLRCGYRGYSEGGLIEDERFNEYAKAVNEHGVNLGVYFFTQAITEEEAISEADFVINMIKDYDIQYPIAFDTEYVSDPEARTNIEEITPEQRSKICIAFCERIREAGYFPIIYASENWMRRELDLTMLTDYDFWAAQYLDENDFMFDFTIWQYTEKGQVPGIDEPVDLNISMVDYASFVPGLKKTVEESGNILTYGENSVVPEPAEGGIDTVILH